MIFQGCHARPTLSRDATLFALAQRRYWRGDNLPSVLRQGAACALLKPLRKRRNPMSLYQPLGFKPKFYWDETAGMKEEKPMLVKLVQSASQRQAMPGKCPSAFGLTVGYTLPCHWNSHYVLWRIIPAGIELRQNQLIFTPAGKGSPIRAVRPEAPEEVEETPKEKENKPKPKEAEEQEESAGTSDPSFVVKYIPLPLADNSPPASPIGVTFLTKRNNHRLVWNVLPSGESLASGVLVLDPWEAPEEEASPVKRWWQKS